MVMVYMGGHVSGAHYNPAVTVGLILRGGIEMKDAIMYMVFQVLGALLAALVVYFLTGNTFAPAPGADVGTVQALVNEIIFTFALVLVILNVATHPKTEGNSYYGLAIGFTVMAGAYAGGGISGGAYNPAVGLGPVIIDSMMGEGGFGNLWLYIVGPVIGSLLATVVFKTFQLEE